MSSMYSSHNSSPRCQRCGASLALNDPRCQNCGYLHAVPTGNNVPQQAQPSWNQQNGQGQNEQTPLSNQPGTQQNSGLLKRYSAQSGQRLPHASQGPLPQPQATSHPVPPRASLNSTPSEGMQQNMTNNRNEYPYASTNQYTNNGYPQNTPQARMSPAPSVNSTTSFNASRATSQQLSPPAYTQNPRAFSQALEKPRRFRGGRIVGALILLLLVVGGSFLAYTFLFPSKYTQQTTSSTTARGSSTSLATPQGTPLFQDEFTNNTNGWSIQSYPGEFSVALSNGTLKLESNNNKLLWELVPGNKTYGDFQLSVDAVLSKGSQDNGYGVYIRSGLSQNASITTFYRFELYGDSSFAIFKGAIDTNGTVTTSRLFDYTNNSIIQKQGGTNHIAISAKGSSLQFGVNGQILSTVSDSSYTSGSIALFVSNLQKASPGAIATFSHLAIYPNSK